MPQMSPMNWWIIMIYMFIVYLMSFVSLYFLILNYLFKNYNFDTSIKGFELYWY